MTAEMPMIRAEGVVRTFDVGGAGVQALRNVALTVARGEFVAVRGRSGSGKTTLLNVLGGLDRPTEGSVVIDGTDVTRLSEAGLVDLRRRTVGYIFQTFGLLPILTAGENVEVPLRLARATRDDREIRVAEVLALVGVFQRMNHRPHELSGGEQQRVAIARALANRPRVLLADEPTGQLDSETGRSIMRLLRSIVDSDGVTAVVATHDPLMLETADRVLELRDGKIVSA
jgi:putative ABC transport system ATP-binding protein